MARASAENRDAISPGSRRDEATSPRIDCKSEDFERFDAEDRLGHIADENGGWSLTVTNGEVGVRNADLHPSSVRQRNHACARGRDAEIARQLLRNYGVRRAGVDEHRSEERRVGKECRYRWS